MNSLILNLSRSSALRSDLDYHLIRAAMIFTFYIFSYQKWFSFEAQQITPFIAHSPLVFWLIPAFGVRGASFFLGTDGVVFRYADLIGLLEREAWDARGAWFDLHVFGHSLHHPVSSQCVGSRGRRLPGHVSSGARSW